VNSGKLLTGVAEDNPEPSCRGFSSTEGAETRSMSPNNNLIQERPAPKGDDIVRTVQKCTEAGYKQPCDNTVDGNKLARHRFNTIR
jgi:hypothetical protein